MIQVYQKGIGVKISPHFKSTEFDCKDELAYWTFIDDKLIDILEMARAYFRRTYEKTIIKITSPYRTPAYNKKIGGSPKSQHMTGRAADIQLFNNGDQIDPKEVYYYFDLQNWNGGVGLYKTFTHIDTRGHYIRW